MSDYTITTQRTYKGKTAGQWVKRAEIATMQAGNVEIVTPDLPGCLLLLTQDDRLVIDNVRGHVVSLYCGVRAIAKMAKLSAAAEAAMLAP